MSPWKYIKRTLEKKTKKKMNAKFKEEEINLPYLTGDFCVC